MIKLKLTDVIFDEILQMGIVLLEDIHTNRVLPIWVGIFEAQAILFKMQNVYFPRPLTHDLTKNIIETLGGKVSHILISKIEENTFYAEVHIKVAEKDFIVDSRPSDAIALAIRTDAPIYVDDKVMEVSSKDKEEFIKEQKDKLYKQFLEYSDLEDENKLKH